MSLISTPSSTISLDADVFMLLVGRSAMSQWLGEGGDALAAAIERSNDDDCEGGGEAKGGGEAEGGGEAQGGGEAKGGGGEAEGEGTSSYAMASGKLRGAALGLIMAGRKRGLLGALAGGTAAARAAAPGMGTGGGGGHEGGGDEGGSSAGGGEDDQAMSIP